MGTGRGRPRMHREGPIVDLYKKGYQPKQIAYELGITYSLTTTVICRARAKGMLPKKFSMKDMGVFFSELPEDIQKWLGDQVPKGASMKDLVTSIVVDAYNEEMEMRDGSETALN